MTPYKRDDLTDFIEQDGADFVVMRSPDTVEHDPDYEELGRFPTRAKAEEFLALYEAT
jgi:hypothetical protein